MKQKLARRCMPRFFVMNVSQDLDRALIVLSSRLGLAGSSHKMSQGTIAIPQIDREFEPIGTSLRQFLACGEDLLIGSLGLVVAAGVAVKDTQVVVAARQVLPVHRSLWIGVGQFLLDGQRFLVAILRGVTATSLAIEHAQVVVACAEILLVIRNLRTGLDQVSKDRHGLS